MNTAFRWVDLLGGITSFAVPSMAMSPNPLLSSEGLNL